MKLKKTLKAIKIGNVLTGTHPLIAVPFAGGSALADVRNCKKQGMDIAELRIDLFSPAEKEHAFQEIKKYKGTPVLATIRSKREGGKWGEPESERLAFFRSILPAVDAIDIELSSHEIIRPLVREARLLKKTIIVSFHNFKNTPNPASLKKILGQAKAAGADIVKIAAMARSKKDVRTLAEFTYAHASKNLITLSMGKEGALSRILFPSLGSLVTYAHAGRSTAPGQWDLKTTAIFFKKLYA